MQTEYLRYSTISQYNTYAIAQEFHCFELDRYCRMCGERLLGAMEEKAHL